MLEKYKKGELSEAQTEQVEADLIRQMFRKQKEESLRNDLKKLAALAADEDEDENERVQNTRMTVVHRSNNQRIWWAAAASVAVLAVAAPIIAALAEFLPKGMKNKADAAAAQVPEVVQAQAAAEVANTSAAVPPGMSMQRMAVNVSDDGNERTQTMKTEKESCS